MQNKSSTVLSISIRYALPVLLATLIILAVGLTGWLSYQSGLDAAESLAKRLNLEVTQRIEERIVSFVELPSVFHEINLSVLQSTGTELTDYDTMRKLFWGEVFVTKSVPYLYYGTKEGYFMGIDTSFGGEPAYKVRDAETAPNRVTYSLTAGGEPLEELKASEYDPRERPWYEAAIKAGKPTWSPIYVFSAFPVLGISPVTPVKDGVGRIIGVLGIDLTLGELSDFLRSLEISPNGQAFIIERDGNMVAASTEEQPFKVVDEKQQRLPVLESQNALVRLAAEELLNYYGDFASITESAQLTFERDGETYYAQVDRVTDERGLDWLSVVVVPASDFMGPVLANLRTTALFGTVVLIVAAILGYLMASWIIRPVFTVTGVAAAIEDANWDLSPLSKVSGRTDELGQLARVFHRMAEEVRAREQELKRQVMELSIQIDQSKKDHQVKEIVESDFFNELQTKAALLRRRRSASEEPETTEGS